MTDQAAKGFFGRKFKISLLKRRVLDLKEGYRQNMAFLGSRFIGKTAFLYKFMEELDDNDLIAVYLNLDNKDFNYFFNKFVGSLLYNYSKVENLPLFNDIHLLLENAKTLIPQTVAEIQKIQKDLAKDKYEETFKNIISLPEIFTSESGKFCVIILDEFQNLGDFGINDVFQELGKKIMTQKRSIYIVSSSVPSEAKKILSEKLSLLFGNFEILEMAPFDPKTSQEFIAYHLKEIRMGLQLRNFLIDFTGGHPLYLNLIVQELSNLSSIHKQTEVFIPLIVQSIENIIFNPWGGLGRHFEIIVNQLCQTKSNRAMAWVLIALSNGKTRLKEIAEDGGLKPSVLIQRINRLIESGIIVRNGNLFHFNDKLFKYWIKYVFQKRLKSFELTSEKQSSDFKNEINHLINNFQRVSEKDLPDRIVELLHCFDNESLQLFGRKYKLPVIHEVVSICMDQKKGCAQMNIMKAESEEGLLLIGFKENLCENDVTAFVNESKKIDQRPQRRLIISLDELDENTRLKALQERMWIWNEKEINALLSFYDKPFIIK